jgi:predicted Fe-Mo cluster-binding NifX family protein
MSSRQLIAVASEDAAGLEGEVAMHFGRCPRYTMVEVEDGRILTSRTVENPHFDQHQPGVMPRFIHGLGAKVIIAGGMGPRAIQMFQGFGVEVATGATGRVDKVVEAYLSGMISGTVPCRHDHPDSCGGHGH